MENTAKTAIAILIHTIDFILYSYVFMLFYNWFIVIPLRMDIMTHLRASIIFFVLQIIQTVVAPNKQMNFDEFVINFFETKLYLAILVLFGWICLKIMMA